MACNIPEEQRPHLHNSWSCESHKLKFYYSVWRSVCTVLSIVVIVIIIINLSQSWATCWPILVSRIQKSLQRPAMIPSASWGIVFRYSGRSITRHSIYMLYPVSFYCLSYNIQYIQYTIYTYTDVEITQDTAATLIEKYLLFNIVHII